MEGILIGIALSSTGLNLGTIAPWLSTEAIIGAEVGSGWGRPEYAMARVLGALLWPVLGLTLGRVPPALIALAVLLVWASTGITVRKSLALAIISATSFAALLATGSMIPVVFALGSQTHSEGSAAGGFVSGILSGAWWGIPVQVSSTALRGSTEFAAGIADSLTLGLALAAKGERSALNAFVEQVNPLSGVIIVLGTTVAAVSLSRVRGFRAPHWAGPALAVAISLITGHQSDLPWMGLAFIAGELAEFLGGPECRFGGLSAVPLLGMLI